MSRAEALRSSLRDRGYEVDRELGRGGMGVVYLATQLSLGRPVALKIIEDERAAPADLARFRREALALRSVEHPHVVRILDLALDHTPPYLVMEFVEGARALEDVFDDLPRERATRFAVARGILEGLAAVHDRGIVHRDLKPGNVLVDRAWSPRLIDFGLARTLTSEETRHTRDGQILGTLAYMSPEQLRGEEVGLASDVYSLGLIAMEVLVGRRLFTNAAAAAERTTYVDRLTSGVPDIRRYAPDLEPALARVLVRCVQPGIDARPATARAVIEQWPDGCDAATRRGPQTAVIAPLEGAPANRVQRRTARAPMTGSAGEPQMPQRPHRWYAAFAGLTLAAVLALAAAWPRTRAPTPQAAASDRAPRASSAPAVQVTLKLEGTDLVVAGKSSAPADLKIRWKSNNGWRELSRTAAVATELRMPAVELSPDLEIRTAGAAVDLGALVQPRLKRLLDLTRPLELDTLLRKVWTSAGRGEATAAGRVIELLPAGVVAALADLGPLLGPALEWCRDEGLRPALASRLLAFEAVETYAERRRVALATRVAPWLPASWVQRVEAPDDPRLRRYNLKDQRSSVRQLGSRVNGVKPAVEWWANGDDWDYFNWTGDLVDRAAGSSPAPDPVFGKPRAPEQYCEISWDHPRELDERHERLMFSIERTGSEDMALAIDLNGRLTFPMLTRPPRGGQRDAAWFLSRFVPPEALVRGRNRLTVRPFALPHAERSAVWIGGVSFIGDRRAAR